MEKRNGARMVYRYSWIAGITGIGLAFWELSSLLRPSSAGTSWPTVILVSILLSVGITWTALAYQTRVWVAVVANIVTYATVVALFVAPETLWGILPTSETLTTVHYELGRAVEIIRHGVEPVRPVPGLIMLLSGLFWILGFLYVAGLLNARPFVATLTPLVIALQFVIIDRRPKSLVHIAVFVAVCAGTLLAVRIDERDHGSGRLARTNATRRPSRRPSVGIGVLVVFTVIASVSAVSFAGERVPDDGIVSWRSPAGYSDEYSGSGTYNLYTDIRANLITQSDNPLFTATFTGDVDPATVRFRMVTLDEFDGNRWKTNRIRAFPIDEEPWIAEGQEYRGPTDSITTQIRIENLQMPWLPTPITATSATTDDDSDYNALRTRRLDGSLYLPGDFTRPGMEYAVTADIAALSSEDYARLARTDDGLLTPLFAAAEEEGYIIASPDELGESLELPDIEYWTNFPEDVSGLVVAEARAITANLATNFEKALALEDYFRSSGGFTYNTQIPSDFTTDSVEDWLFDDTNEFVRSGYCEQFALTMALMARTIGLPSRVLIGFTPGRPINDSTVLVMDQNAHSWVEIWIPSHGWMTFDPTPRGDFTVPTVNEQISDAFGFSAADYAALIPAASLVNAGGDLNAPNNPALGEGRDQIPSDVFVPSGQSASGVSGLEPWIPGAIVAIAVLILAGVLGPGVKWLRRKRRSRRLAKGDITAAWVDITERLADLGEDLDPAATPVEAASRQGGAFVDLAQTYGTVIYGEKPATAEVIAQTREAHKHVNDQIRTDYNRRRRLVAAYRPTKIKRRLRSVRGKRSTRSS